MNWECLPFGDLGNQQLYALLAARQQVFVLEQQCLYPDLDGLDQEAHHLLGWSTSGPDAQLLAYLRILAPGVKFAEASLGRVLTTPAGRGTGAGRELLARGIAEAEVLYPGAHLRIGAQHYLEKFYASYGFVTVSVPYDEDGIAHIDMLR
jgi:ElaA protein